MANINTVETRDKFGVPLAGNQGNGILMPKLQYRFRVTMLAGFGGEPQSRVLTQNVQSVTRPSVSFPEVIIDSYNSKSYIHGKHEWSTIDVVVRDDITRQNAKTTVDRFLGQLVTSRGLFDFLTVCDSSNNTPDRIDRNELWVDIAIQPVKSIEFIYVPIRIQNTLGETGSN